MSSSGMRSCRMLSRWSWDPVLRFVAPMYLFKPVRKPVCDVLSRIPCAFSAGAVGATLGRGRAPAVIRTAARPGEGVGFALEFREADAGHRRRLHDRTFLFLEALVHGKFTEVVFAEYDQFRFLEQKGMEFFQFLPQDLVLDRKSVV